VRLIWVTARAGVFAQFGLDVGRPVLAGNEAKTALGHLSRVAQRLTCRRQILMEIGLSRPWGDGSGFLTPKAHSPKA
jgi:hypothetical protein